ncbi:stage II sporulation protein D [Serpentinicella sp. ANB-PHB4]|uniref:stage II sporulation protein D n=1 Tax=Serpentinicella sp. ANB-PHB4 TaxID=3074076 RepID=UPI002863E7A2|nr:stage II sporulation protein D [Serpentinicella sp. ANB-PHB4]MDR5659706.1 stage II sporulation protein D [Serpentinicella sp. ANB-PHB4]
MRGIFFAIIIFIIVVILIPIFIFTSCDLSVEKNDYVEKNIVESDLTVTVYNHKTDEIMKLDLEEYIANVVAAEMPARFEMEALKAQSVAARTYAIWRYLSHGEEGHPEHPGAVLCTSHQHCQEWLSKEELKERHGSEWMKTYWPKIQEAVNTTTGIVMTYDMKPIEPLYHSTSGGVTENSEDIFTSAVPYLRSVSSPYETESPVLVDTKRISVKEFVNTIKKEKSNIRLSERNLMSQIKIGERTQGGTIKEITIGNETLTGSQIRRLFELRSADFEIDVDGNTVEFTTRGYGHGVGMSQWGAQGMAEQGSNFVEILEHYYLGVTLSKIKSYRD